MEQLQKAYDYTATPVRSMATRLAAHSPGKYNLGQVCEIYDHCYSHWRYVDDPRSLEVLTPASTLAKDGLIGDCDDFALLVGALVSAVGGEVRIQKAYNRYEGHSYCEVNLGATPRSQIEAYLRHRYPQSDTLKKPFHFRDDETGLWLNLDWNAPYPGGPYFKADRSTAFHLQDGYCQDY